jgi:preprotein translocase subunit SecE
MATQEDDKLDDLAASVPRQEGLVRLRSDEPEAESESEQDPDARPTALGTGKYVHAAFFAAAILGAYISGKLLLGAWNQLADWTAAVRAIPQLVEYAEDERETWTLIVGAVVGVLVVLRVYSRPGVRTWANEVAVELSRVTWPNREAVTNGTVVVVVASIIAAVYVSVLDRLWAFLSTLVYGA